MPPSLLIYIFHILRIYINNNHIQDQNVPGHNGQYGQNGHNGHYGIASYGHEYGWYWCLCEEQGKCRSAVKAELKNLHRFKSYGQNKIDSEIMAISFVFSPHFCPKLTTLGEALPMGPQTSSLCFWNPWNM